MTARGKRELLDPVLHEASRLMLVSVLNACGSANFNFLLASTELSRGNFSTHMTRLVEAGYVEERKFFVGKRPQTEYRLSRKGRRALEQYRKAWASVVSGEAFEEHLADAEGARK